MARNHANNNGIRHADEPLTHSGWPCLGQLGLSPEEVASRRAGIGGSDASIIVSGDPERVHALWEVKRGLRPAEDLSDVLPVMLGCWTEPFNRQWFEKITGQSVDHIGSTLICQRHSWRRCTLDGLVRESGAVFEAKHTNAFGKPEDVLERYMPQLQHNMAVAQCDKAVLSVLFGNHKFEIIEVGADWLYQVELLEAEQAFWKSVINGSAPSAPSPPPTPKPIGVREVCLQGSNTWAAAAADWLTQREAAQSHARACATLKSLVEDDVARAFGHGIEAKRSKSGAISIRELAK
jgi:hypothetical protein